MRKCSNPNCNTCWHDSFRDCRVCGSELAAEVENLSPVVRSTPSNDTVLSSAGSVMVGILMFPCMGFGLAASTYGYRLIPLIAEKKFELSGPPFIALELICMPLMLIAPFLWWHLFSELTTHGRITLEGATGTSRYMLLTILCGIPLIGISSCTWFIWLSATSSG